jgi:alginate O-acetyltransferase complex protein AlgI
LRRWAGWTGPSNMLTRLAAISITFTAVLVAWVFFRAADLGTASVMLRAMIGLGSNATHSFSATFAWYAIPALLAIVWWAPNSAAIVSYAFVKKYELQTPTRFALQRSPAGPLIFGLLLALCLMSLTHVTEFLYFQF